MPLLKRWRDSASPAPLFKTPIFDHGRRNPLLWSVGKITALFAALIFGLLWFGSPALLISWDGNGRSVSTVYYNCTYFNLMSGFETYTPSGVFDNCPAIIFYEVEFFDLISLFSNKTK